jgi:hypothetical protein
MAPKQSDTMRFTAVPFSAMIQKRSLSWTPPRQELLSNPESGDFVWCRLQYVFKLADPRDFPATVAGLTSEEETLLRRFVAQTVTLAGTSFMNAQDSLKINIPDGNAVTEQIEQNLSAPDITTGHMVFLRQCYSDDEEASFAKSRKIIERRLHAAGKTSALDLLKAWRRAHAKRRGRLRRGRG